MKTAIISGARGQDSAWLSRLLLEKEYRVVAFERHVQSPDYSNIREIMNHSNYILEKGDVTDAGNISRLVSLFKPDEFYHLAANSFVGCSWSEPSSVLNVNTIGTLNCLESIRLCSPKTKFLFASTSEVVGNSKDKIQNENTIHTPHSPYAISKVAGEHLCHVYQFSHGLFTSFTRCYNHESKFRGKEFVTRKITDWIGRSYNKVYNRIHFGTVEQRFLTALNEGVIDQLKLGNINSCRDWLDARDCVRGMYLTLQLDKPDCFVLASGQMHSIRDLLDVAFNYIGIYDWKPFVGQDPKYMRPDDVVTLCGDYSKARNILGWKPEVDFNSMIHEMIQHDIEINKTTAI